MIRGHVGRFSLWSRLSIPVDLKRRQLLTRAPEVVVTDPDSAVLQPDLTTDTMGNLGIAVLSDAGIRRLEVLRAAALTGNVFGTEPRFDSPDRAMAYQWGWSFGIQRELAQDVALTADYVANATRDQTLRIDINEPVNGVRPGVDVFDPNGELVPFDSGARGVPFRRVFQYQTPGSVANGDYKAFLLGIRKRFADRWGMRTAYTLQRANRVGRGLEATVWLDNDIRADYGRGEADVTHVFTLSGTFHPVGGLSLSALLSAQSGTAENETTGTDDNGDRDRSDRPIPGVTDAGLPIVSEIGANGAAVIQGLDGPSYFGFDFSLRYTFEL